MMLLFYCELHSAHQCFSIRYVRHHSMLMKHGPNLSNCCVMDCVKKFAAFLSREIKGYKQACLCVLVDWEFAVHRHWQFLHFMHQLRVHEISKIIFCTPTCFLFTVTLTDVVCCGTKAMVKSNHSHHLLVANMGQTDCGTRTVATHGTPDGKL